MKWINAPLASARALRPFKKTGLWIGVAALVTAIVQLGPADPPPVLRVGISNWPGYAPAYLARDGDWPTDLIRPVELPTDSEIVHAMRAGLLEAACMTLDGALRVVAAGIDLRVLTVLDYSEGGDAIVAIREPLAGVAALRSKRVAAARSGIGILFLARALKQSGMNLTDVNYVNADILEHARLIADGRVDAVVTYSPYKDRLVAAGGRVICDSSQFPKMIIDVLVVRTDCLARNRRAVHALLRGILQATRLLQADPGAASAVAEAMRLSPEEFARSRGEIHVPTPEELKALLTGPSPGLVGAARELAKELGMLGLPQPVSAPVDLLLKPSEVEVAQP